MSDAGIAVEDVASSELGEEQQQQAEQAAIAAEEEKELLKPAEPLPYEKQLIQDTARMFIEYHEGPETTATDETNKTHNKSPKTAVEALKANDPTFSVLDLSGNTIMSMKHSEYCAEIAEGLRTNTHVKEINLGKCEIDTADAIKIADALAVNDTVEVLNLEKNKITNEGATAIWEALKTNKRLTELNLIGQPHQFGDACLEACINMFDYNVTLSKIIWRLESRKSFPINKLIVRNNTIAKFLLEGRDVSAKIPSKCNIKLLLGLTGHVRGDELKRLGDSLPAAARVPGIMTSEGLLASPKTLRKKDAKAISKGSTGTTPTHSPSVQRKAYGSDSPVAPTASAATTAAESPSKPSAGGNALQDLLAKDAEKAKPAEVVVTTPQKVHEEPAEATPVPAVVVTPAEERKETSSSSPSVQSKATETASQRRLAGLRSEGDPSSSPGQNRRLSGTLRSKASPSTFIAQLEQNDPGLTVLKFEKDTSYQMKHKDYTLALAAALATNTHLVELVITECDLDSQDAIQIANALRKNRTLRYLDMSKNKISNEGSQELAEALKENPTLVEISLIGQPHPFGENCLESWLSLFEFNISLRKIIWRLDSRKSFPINKFLVRNNSIKKFVDEGRDTTELRVPEKANCTVQSLKDHPALRN